MIKVMKASSDAQIYPMGVISPCPQLYTCINLEKSVCEKGLQWRGITQSFAMLLFEVGIPKMYVITHQKLKISPFSFLSVLIKIENFHMFSMVSEFLSTFSPKYLKSCINTSPPVERSNTSFDWLSILLIVQKEARLPWHWYFVTLVSFVLRSRQLIAAEFIQQHSNVSLSLWRIAVIGSSLPQPEAIYHKV